jgi:hypothetical protein
VKPEQITPPCLTPLMRSRGGIVISKPRAHSPPRGHLSRLIKPKRKPIAGGVPLRELKIEWASPDAEEDCLLKVAMEPLLNNVLMAVASLPRLVQGGVGARNDCSSRPRSGDSRRPPACS